jgi:hypothetical protein
MRRFLNARLIAALFATAIVFVLASLAHADLLATFEDVVTDTSYAGAGGGSYWNGSNGSGGFTSGGLDFVNNYNSTFGSWDGWAYSNTTDTTTAGFGNQYSAAAGGGANGSARYGVFFQPFNNGMSVSVAGGETATFSGAYFTNTTYTALSMLNGDSFSKKFGGASGNEADWFLLTVTGLDLGGFSTGSLELYLADYRFANNALDYILTDWAWLDLNSLGEVAGLQFSLSSSDVGDFGMNTPAFFAMDDLASVQAVPEPATSLLWGLGSALVFCRARYRRRRRSQ